MSETTIAAPLSGEEVVETIVYRVRQALFGDCHLNPYLAYLSFEAEITVKVKLRDNGRDPEVEQQIRVSGGSSEIRQELKTQEWSSSYVYMEDAPPNAVRQSANLPIPTIVERSDGRKEQTKMKYARKTEEQPGHEHEKKHEPHDPSKPPQPQPGQQPAPQPHPGQQEPKR